MEANTHSNQVNEMNVRTIHFDSIHWKFWMRMRNFFFRIKSFQNDSFSLCLQIISNDVCLCMFALCCDIFKIPPNNILINTHTHTFTHTSICYAKPKVQKWTEEKKRKSAYAHWTIINKRRRHTHTRTPQKSAYNCLMFVLCFILSNVVHIFISNENENAEFFFFFKKMEAHGFMRIH